jgi:hypothetical protein
LAKILDYRDRGVLSLEPMMTGTSQPAYGGSCASQTGCRQAKTNQMAATVDDLTIAGSALGAE